jgi:SAM-dependent methyltransferase
VKACNICGNTDGNKIHNVGDHWYGTPEWFNYIECSACSCLQIETIPDNLSSYYDNDDYYSFKPLDRSAGKCKIFVKKNIYKISELSLKLNNKRMMGIFPGPNFLPWLSKAKVKFTSHILDIGCGIGDLLLYMQSYGFSELVGIDPFLDADIYYPCGLDIYKKYPTEIDSKFDFIMMHHSLEHIPDQHAIFKTLDQLLNPGGYCMIRLPVVSSYAWHEYGLNWWCIDAPRHLYLHSDKSIQLLADSVNLEVVDKICDSSELQFIASEEIGKGICVLSEGSYFTSQPNSHYSSDYIQSLAARAEELNKQGNGDMAGYFLRKPA